MNTGKLLFILISLIGSLALTLISTQQLGQVSYRLAWTLEGVRPEAEGWRVTNDLGYEVYLSRGYLVTYSTELIMCQADTSATTWLFELLGPGLVYAGHGSEDNASRLTASYIEDLSRPAAVELETLTLTPHRYCQVHYLIGPAGAETTQNLPGEVEMVGQSLFIAGEYLAPGAKKPVPFTLTSRFPDGIIRELQVADSAEKPVVGLVTNDKSVVITLRRELGTMFDGVDFARMSKSEQARAVLRALTDGTCVWVTEK